MNIEDVTPEKRMINKKKVIIILGIILIIVVAVLVSVKILNNRLKTYESKYGVLDKKEDMYIDVIDDTVTATSLSYEIYNNTNEEITYGVDYEIECYKENEWKEYGIEICWIDIGVILKANSSNEENIEWKTTYGKLPKGKYRIIKKVNNVNLFDEFEIK